MYLVIIAIIVTIKLLFSSKSADVNILYLCSLVLELSNIFLIAYTFIFDSSELLLIIKSVIYNYNKCILILPSMKLS